ncbi:hypothetical protein VKT23_015320 [Stygiomarasmius scandens]|uniref:Uncharacterized protein n=1 Tax=Marasmiellus scandens TaxID=2682957 RepID=A0ABR1J0I5_9AGAR
MLRTQEFPPFHPNQLDDDEKALLRMSTKEMLMQEIRMYRVDDRDIGWGYDHHWGLKQVDYGRGDWYNVGRTYRICYNPEHHDSEAPCTQHWLSQPLRRHLRKALDHYRAIFDMTGEPWCPFTLPTSQQVLNQALWDQMEHTTIPALRGIFERLCPYTEYTNDDYSASGSDNDDDMIDQIDEDHFGGDQPMENQDKKEEKAIELIDLTSDD